MILVLVALVSIGLFSASARADGTPGITASVTSSTTLFGNPVHVTVAAANPGGEPYGYNLSFRVVLPQGVTYSGGGPVAPQQIANQPNSGETTLIFSNVSDLSPNSTKEIGFDLQYSQVLYDAGDTFPVSAQAFVNTDPRFIPKFNAEGDPEGPKADSFTGFTQPVSGTQTLKAIEVEIEEPSPEGEILRGVHDHQTVYTLKVTNNGVNPTTGTKLDAYVPAGLEFLGCGGAGADNTTNAPTNPGSAEEYPGSGPIDVEPLAGCVEPESVETEVVDPDGPGPMSSGVYTHVIWPVGTLEDGETKVFPYRAAVPIRANTNTFTGARPSAASGNQAANLDNNNGSEVLDESLLRTYASASGTYQGSTPGPTSDSQVLDRTAEDWVVHKSGSSGTLAQGAITQWTLTFETSEYKFVDDASVTDTLPSGLCPLGPANYTTQNTPDDSECAPVGGQEPSAPYSSATENADGTFTIIWDSGSLAKLGHTGISDKFTITFPTKTRVNYQQNFEATTPILTHDRIANTVATEGAGWARCTSPGTPDCSTPGPKIDFDGIDGSTIVDASGAEQEAGGPVISKQVAQSGTDCQAATYVNTVPRYHPGDRVCWRVRVDFPGAVDTSPQAIADYMPASVSYETGSDEETPADNVISTADESGAGDGLLTWTVSGSSVPAGSQVFEHVFSTIAQPPGTPATGDLTGNLLKFSSVNTPGESIPQRAEAEYAIDTPEVDLVKGVEKIVRGGSTVDGPNGPNVDNKQVEADDEVTYRVDVTNAGAQDAVNVEVWDFLPADYDCSEVAAISDGGECIDTSPRDRVVWTVAEIAKETSKKLTYTATVPSDIGPGRSLVNDAGVREFAGETNLGGEFVYTPANNIDPDNETTPNAPAADDPSNVNTAAAAIAKAQSTEIEETGNDKATQATIGEKVQYTLTATVPEGTTLGGIAEITDTVSSTERLSYVSGSAAATLNGVAVPGTFTIDTSGPTPKLVFPAGYANAPGSGNDLVVLGFEMVVTNVAANSRTAANVTNQAALKWTDPVTGAKSTPSNTTSAQIVEPLISQTKTDNVNPSTVAPGQIVQYTVRATNSNATRVSTAHDVKIVDHVPAGLIPISPAPGNLPIADGNIIPGTGGAVWDADTRTITRTTATVAPNTSTTLIYRVEVEKPAVAGASFTNEVESTVASLGATSTGRRTTGTGYKATAKDTIRIAGAAVVKQVNPGEATPGDPLDYTLKVTIPANVQLFDTTVVDVLPAGVEFDGYRAETCLSGCPLANAVNRYDFAPQPDGSAKVAWDLGDIPALSQPQEIELTYDAHLRATERTVGDDVLAGDIEVNTATVSSNLTDGGDVFDPGTIPDEFDETSAQAEASVDVVEPRLTLDKRIKVGAGAFGDGPVTTHSDDQLAYQLVIENEGDSPAYDVEVTDVLDPALTNVVVVPQAGVTVTEAWSAATNSMKFEIDGPIVPGVGVTIEYTAELVAAAQLHDGQEVPNVAAIPLYFGVSQADREAEPSWEYVEYFASPDTVEALIDFPTLELEKTTGLAGDPETGSAEINQPFPWRIVVANSSATAGAANVEVRDTLPPNWAYVAGSAEFDGAAAPDPNLTPNAGGDALEWTLPTLAAGADVEITFDAKPLPAAAQVPGTGPEAHENVAAVVSAQDEAGNSGNEEGPYGTAPDDATATLVVPQLEVEKTPDGGGATAGSPSSFTIEVDNEGDGVARNVKVKDLLPAGLSYEAGTATASPSAGFSETEVNPGPGAGEMTIEWAIASIPANSSVQIELPVKVAATVADGTTLTNKVGVTSDEETPPVEDEGSLEVETEADVAITKTGPATYTPGEKYTWQLRVQNLGPSTAQNVHVTDELPAGAKFDSADAPCDEGFADVVGCSLGTLPPGFDQTYAVTVTIQPDVEANPLSNTAKVETDTDDTNPSNDESTYGPTPSSLADVWVEKSVSPETIDRNQQTTFTIVVGNDGPSTARTVTLEDSLPAGLEFVSEDSPDCSVELPPVVSCEFGDLAPDATRTFHVTVKGIANGEHTNIASVETVTPEPENDKPNSDDATVIVGPVADLALEKTGPATVAADGELTWTLKATNNGEDPATGVEITDPLPAGTVFVSADPGCTLEGAVVVCAIGNLAVAESAERQISVTVPRALADTTVVNSATVDGDQGDDEPGNDSDEAATEVGPSADVSIVKTGPARVNADGTMTWTLAINNAGPSTATDLTVKDALPAGVELQTATPTQGSCAGAVECQLGTLPKGAAAQIQVVVHVPAALEGASLLNSATVTAEEPDPLPENNESKAKTIVDPPAPSDYDLAVSKTVDGSAKPNLGDTVDYEILVSNRGPATATEVKIVDALPASLEYVKAGIPGGKCTLDGAVITCKVASLAAGAEVRARVSARVMAESTVKNTATVSAAVADADPGNDKSTAKVRSTLAETKLKVRKTRLGKGSVSAGDRIKYKIRVANVGDGPAADVVVCDRLPGKLSFASLSGAQLEGGDACWEIDLLWPGDSKSFRLAARVDGGVGGGLVRNVAYVKAENAPGSQGVAGVQVEHTGPGRAGGVTG